MKYIVAPVIILMFFPTLCSADIPIIEVSLYVLLKNDINLIQIILPIIFLVIIIVSLLEAYFLKILLFKSFKKALKLSLIVNLITTLLGGFLKVFPEPYYGDNIAIATETIMVIVLSKASLFPFIGSFLIESLFLKLLARNYAFKKIILASFCANLASYALILSWFLFMV